MTKARSKGAKRRAKKAMSGCELAPVKRRAKQGKARMSEIRETHKSSVGRMCVYAIEMTGTNFVKVGVSTAPYERMMDLQTSSPMPLRMRFIAEMSRSAAFSVEAAIHSTPEWILANGVGEWAEISSDVVPLIIMAASEHIGAKAEVIAGGASSAADREIRAEDSTRHIPNGKVYR